MINNKTQIQIVKCIIQLWLNIAVYVVYNLYYVYYVPNLYDCPTEATPLDDK